MEKLLTINQVAEKLQVSKSLIYKWVHYSYVPYVKIGRLIRFQESAIDTWLRRKRRKGRNMLKIAID